MGGQKVSQKKGGKGRKIGRGKKAPSHMHYNYEHRRAKNKVVRIARSSGLEAATEYAGRNMIEEWWHKRSKTMPVRKPKGVSGVVRT